jgi:mono/diheme cytochrome c family protein
MKQFLLTGLFVTLATFIARGANEASFVEISATAAYNKQCATCHGRDGTGRTARGRRSHSRNLTDAEWQDRVSDERIFNSIMNGKGKMPSYSKKLSEQQIDALVTHVRHLRK